MMTRLLNANIDTPDWLQLRHVEQKHNVRFWLLVVTLTTLLLAGYPANAADEFPPPITNAAKAEMPLIPSTKTGINVRLQFACIGGVQYVWLPNQPLTLLVRTDGLPRTCEDYKL